MHVKSHFKQALAAISGDSTAILQDLRQMLAVDTSFPPGNGYGAFANLMESLLTPMGFTFQRVSVPESLWHSPDGSAVGERINLLATLPADAAENCNLYFHVDTVPPGDGWHYPPLVLSQTGERLIGRGSADMKGTIVAALAALRAAQRYKLKLRFNPVLLLCTDEEGGLYPGIRYLAEQQLFQGHMLSFNGGAVPRIWAGCFGSLDVKIRVTGRAAHSGDPVDGINAIEESQSLMQALMALKQRVEKRTSAMPSPPHFAGKPLTSRLTLAMAQGGSKGSTLPACFDLLVNRRYAPEEHFDDVWQELTDCITQSMSSSAALSTEHYLIGHLAPVSDPTGPHWPRWQHALSLGFGFHTDDFAAWGSSTSSDMGWVQQAGIQEILLGGLARPDNHIHAADEYTTMQDLVALSQSILAYLADDFSPTQGISL
ncbi:M20/M25/M40 family metallo-hydrolase [Pectobacteriaceae bacterium C52]|uniref:Acetylornithine deacetylase n=1 Tax=Serratia sp. (strain ATCC 39006) TaxID=104623 RepID=A0A2I5T5E2_SERS3|nr:M20/M25/M40 family metallo-hydrolase [Serratia sp. ATCC 39006]AUG99790.1 acetylornithine deacetylase [Serratia sp. ATCC 39006]AUH04109.1 acetylornithine deacetylase [Serratia sp. ATCC 39006]WJV61684.1 M20/M25/M40 family metallo-hydrolase [Pectobacteriaceae bacterium C52]